MRLPEFLTQISPVRETLEALEQGEAALARAVAEKNAQVCVATADDGLALWEADWGLPVREGAPLEDRRSAVRAALAGGRTLTPGFLAELCVTLGGADRGEVEEDFPNWHVTAIAVARGTAPDDPGRLARAVERLKPAHLTVEVLPGAELEARFRTGLHGSAMAEVPGGDVQRAEMARRTALTGGVLVEVGA